MHPNREQRARARQGRCLKGKSCAIAWPGKQWSWRSQCWRVAGRQPYRTLTAPNIAAPSPIVALTDPLPIVHSVAKASWRSLDVMLRGLNLNWAKDIKIGSWTFNAKVGEVDTKPALRKAFQQQRRCLVMLDSFYESKKTATGKQSYAIAIADRWLTALAGLWKTWRSPADERLRFKIIIRTLNESFAVSHNRMPAFLKRVVWLEAGY
jgi:putative SOS response-associated peptidase YedK